LFFLSFLQAIFMTATEILSNRGRAKAVHGGFVFVYDKLSADKQTDFWRCEKKGNGCMVGFTSTDLITFLGSFAH
jgi:hypothetical protein